MEFKVKFLIICVVVAMAYASPMPQEEVEVATVAATRPPRPTHPRPNRPLINAITSAFQSINSAFTTAGNLAQNAFGTVATTGYTAAQNAAEGANYYLNSAADTFQSGLNTVNQNINLATGAWLPTSAPAIVPSNENAEPASANEVSEVFVPEAIAA